MNERKKLFSNHKKLNIHDEKIFEQYLNVKFFLSENWFICINWLRLKLHVFDI